ncbi:MAG: hypothetical protein AAFQ98_09550 [Bacteroidota bacterium]
MIKRLLVVSFAIVLGWTASAQTLDMDQFENMKARNIGPAGMAGRVTAIDVVTDDPNVMYIGAASGGVWKSTSGGIKWEPIFEEEKTASIGAIAIQQSNPDVIWVGTGEGNPRNSLNGGFGIYKSLDGGHSWKAMGLEETRHIHRIVIDPTDPNTVYVGAIGSPWGEHPERGVYKTTDGGETWEKVLFVNNKTGVADLVMDPTNPNKLIAAMWEHLREPWTFTSGGPGSGLYVTHDGGKTWEKRTDEDGLPKGDLGRIGLAIAPSMPNRIYALVEAKKNALYRSDDGGISWRKINDKPGIGNRPFYYSDIRVDPMNENRIYSIFTYVNVSEDGGKSFSQLMPAYGVSNGVHPDHHAWWIHPNDPEFMMEGNDGGLNITRDGGKSWRFVETLPLAQFYHINVDMELPYNVYGGMQDNGSWGGPAYIFKAQGIRNHYWQELAFGDGFDVVPDPDDSRYGYAMSQQGNVVRYDRVTGSTEFVRPTHPDYEMNANLRFNWNAPIAQDPFNNSTIYYGSQFVHQSNDKGKTYQVISPDLTTNDPEKQKQHLSGGLTMDATGAENHTTLLVIEPSAQERGLIWAGSDDGLVHITRDGGENWTNVTGNIPGFPAGAWVPQIKASAHSAGEALVIVNDYRRYNYEPYAWRTRDYGATWERIVDANDVISFTLSIVQDPVEPNLYFLGTDDGLYVSVDGAKSWTKWTQGVPTVPVADMVIHPREHDLILGTFGRAAFVLDDIRPLRALAANQNVASQPLTLFDPPTGVLAAYQQPAGSRFGGDALFNAENRPYGARISYWINKPEAEDKEEAKEEEPATGRRGRRGRGRNAEPAPEPEEEMSDEDAPKVKWDSVRLEIYDGDRLIRTLKWKAPKENGLHRTTWFMDEKGGDFPSREIRQRRGNREPSGVTVKPGTYTLKMFFGDQESTSEVEIINDPRLESGTTDRDVNEVYDASKRMESYISTAADAAKQLAESLKIAQSFAKEMREADKEEYKEQIDLSKEMADSIGHIQDLFFGKEDDRQGITRDPDPNVIRRVFQASRYIQSRAGAPTATEERLMEQALQALNEWLEIVNGFYTEVWPGYVEEMNQVDIPKFEDTETFSIEE